MEAKEMMTKFDELYNMMSSSDNVENMEVFGDVMCEMMEDAINTRPEKAQSWLDKLESIRWKNYLTRSEAGKIAGEMEPKAAWDFATWKQMVEALGLEPEREFVFNKYALYVVMNTVYSDSGKSIAKLLGKTLAEVPAEKMVAVTHDFAIDLLTDADGKYNVRAYFGV